MGRWQGCSLLVNIVLLENCGCSDILTLHSYKLKGDENLKIGLEGYKLRERILPVSSFLPVLQEREGAGACWLWETEQKRPNLEYGDYGLRRRRGEKRRKEIDEQKKWRERRKGRERKEERERVRKRNKIGEKKNTKRRKNGAKKEKNDEKEKNQRREG